MVDVFNHYHLRQCHFLGVLSPSPSYLFLTLRLKCLGLFTNTSIAVRDLSSDRDWLNLLKSSKDMERSSLESSAELVIVS